MGSTASDRLVKATWEDHPHIHGEHSYRSKELGHSQWITPIYMGSTIRKGELEYHREDHPHIHGEHHIFTNRMFN